MRELTPTITLLSDGTTYGDGAGPFGLVPRPKWMKLLPPDEQNRVPMEMWCALVRSGGKNILIDCGAGDKDLTAFSTQYALQRPHGTLLDDLARAGVTPDEIDLVILTHLHGDHSGWATRRDAAGRVVPTFPNARYAVQRQEYHDATHPNERTRNTYFADNFVPLAEAGVLDLLDGEKELLPGITVAPAPGHCLGLQCVVIAAVGAQPVFFIGDLAPYAVHFARTAWVTAYDVFPMTTIETKKIWQERALREQPLLIFAHDTVMPTGRLIRTAKGFLDVVSP